MVAIEAHFKQETEADSLQPLRMEHFYFPLGLWFVGTILSAIDLLAEITIKSTRKSKRNTNEDGQ